MKNKLETLADSKRIFLWVALLSFCESTFVPVPLEAVLIPIMLSCRSRRRTFGIALAATAGCLLGAAAGYSIGAMFFDAWSHQIASLFGSPEQLQQVMLKMEQDGFTYVLAVGLTPVPFQIAMLAAGAIQFSFVLFMLATLISRGIRYFGLAVLVYYFGHMAMDIMKRYKYQVVSAISLAFVAFFVAQNYII